MLETTNQLSSCNKAELYNLHRNCCEGCQMSHNHLW